jgi:hypothetical protein
MYWAQDAIPEYVELAASTWIKKNPSWKFHMVSDTNLHKYVVNETILAAIGRQETLPFKSDLVRTSLLADHGGVYVDADVLSSAPLDEWLAPYTKSGFFAYRVEGDVPSSAEQTDIRSCSSWFLAAARNDYISSALKNALLQKFLTRTHPDQYYEWHFTFTRMIKDDQKFKQLWDAVPKLFSIHEGQFRDKRQHGDECVVALRHLKSGLTSTSCVPLYERDDCLTVKQLIDGHCSPVYKISRAHESDPDLFDVARYVASQ